MVTSAELKKLFPTAKPDLVAAIVDGWPLAEQAGITTQKRIAEFLANIGAETGGLTSISESLNYSVDGLLKTFSRSRISERDARRLGRKKGERALSVARQREIANLVYGGAWGRKNLGNTQPNDGWDMRGGGMMQTTGRTNYRAMGFENNPGALRHPATAFATAVREWAKRGCNALADKGDTAGVRRKINGGSNGLRDVKAYRGKAMAIFADVKAPKPAAPPAPKPELPDTGSAVIEPRLYTDKTTVEVVQRKLFDLGYTEVGSKRPDGSFDGDLGKLTRAAILAFRDDNGLPRDPVIDDALLAALDTADPRKLSPIREDATDQDVRQKVPEVHSNFLTRIVAFFGGILSLIAAAFDGILGNIGAASGYIQPVKDAVGDMPGWVWFLLIAIIAGGLYLVARRGEVSGAEAFRTGARR